MGFGDVVDGITGGINTGLKAGENLIDAGKEKLGEGVDYVSDKTGDALDEVGLDKAGDWVHEAGDRVAAGLGATPSEQGLGHTEDPTELVHGNPGKVRESAKHLKDFYTAFDHVGQGMKKVRSSGWTGEGGDAFRRKFEMHPTKWMQAADACEDAARVLDSYADTVKWAQDKAQDAIDLYKKGERTYKAAAEAYNKKADAYNVKALSGEDPGPKPEPFDDGAGKADMDKAADILADARRGRNEASAKAAAAIRAALAHAPAEPPPLDRIGNDIVDGYQAYYTELTHVAGGALKGTAGLLNFARGLNPTDPYNLTHPAAYYQNVNMTLSGLVSTATHPERVVQAAVDGFKKDPSEFIGRLIPELIGTKGAGLAKGGLRLAVKEGTEAAATNVAARGVRSAETAVGKGPHLPDSWKLDDVDAGVAKHADDGLSSSSQPSQPSQLSQKEFAQLGVEEKHALASSEISGGARQFADEGEAVSYGREVWNDYADNLPESGKKALWDYSDEHSGAANSNYATYKEMNGYLRGDADLGTPDVLQHIEDADKALAGRPVPEDITVVRGQGINHLKVDAPDDLIGQVLGDRGFMSTSLGDNGAVAAFKDSKAILHLRVPEGHPAMWIENVGKFGMGERELLLGRGTEYQVTRAFEDGGQWHIYGDVLPKQ
ncbi:putative T7SS-secreted protein [Streptomyces sp. NPDC048484]|uniref:putative T7SS-secreted protein n=1 Tax=Streptomyces sp. NPDC048484 TaxID=3155146 RepID=UPI003446A8FC